MRIFWKNLRINIHTIQIDPHIKYIHAKKILERPQIFAFPYKIISVSYKDDSSITASDSM